MKWKTSSLALLSAAIALPVLAFSAPRVQAEETIDYIPLTVANPGFEQSSTSLPGWTVSPALPAAGLDVQVVRNQAFEGSSSVKIVDNKERPRVFALQEKRIGRGFGGQRQYAADRHQSLTAGRK